MQPLAYFLRSELTHGFPARFLIFSLYAGFFAVLLPENSIFKLVVKVSARLVALFASSTRDGEL
jgi:hypothetical protein